MKLSILIPVLDSHQVFQRQLLHFRRLLPIDKAELLIADDGSSPKLVPHITPDYNLRMLYTNDIRPWTQPKALNDLSKIAKGDYFLITNIDHVITKEAIDAAMAFNGDKMDFLRKRAILDEAGQIVTDPEIVRQYAAHDKEVEKTDVHYNTFVMAKWIFEELGGYDEKFCGKYGGDDVDFSKRYGEMCRAGKVVRCVRGPLIYVYPNAREDVKNLFHRLRAK